MGRRGYRLRAHRVAYALSRNLSPGEMDPKMVVMHSCDNPRCCNPAHLGLGTQAENLRDMHAKRRHPRTKLDSQKARDIRADDRPFRLIAAAYGVSPALIYAVKQGRLWAEAG